MNIRWTKSTWHWVHVCAFRGLDKLFQGVAAGPYNRRTVCSCVRLQWWSKREGLDWRDKQVQRISSFTGHWAHWWSSYRLGTTFLKALLSFLWGNVTHLLGHLYGSSFHEKGVKVECTAEGIVQYERTMRQVQESRGSNVWEMAVDWNQQQNKQLFRETA